LKIMVRGLYFAFPRDEGMCGVPRDAV